MPTATFEIYADDDIIEVIKSSLGPEIKYSTPRSIAKLKDDKDILILEIEAEDISALRASVNSYLRWIKLSLDASKISEGR